MRTTQTDSGHPTPDAQRAETDFARGDAMVNVDKSRPIVIRSLRSVAYIKAMLAAVVGLAWIAASTIHVAAQDPEWISRPEFAAASSNPGWPSQWIASSKDGNRILFTSLASNLTRHNVQTPGWPWQNLFVRDLSQGTNLLVSVGLDGNTGGNDNANEGAFSADGRWVTFTSRASNLVPGDTNAIADIFLRDLVQGTTILLSTPSFNPTNAFASASGPSANPSISEDGRLIAFESAANNLTSGDTNASSDIFVHDRLTGKLTRVSVGIVTGPRGARCFAPAISESGERVWFLSIPLGRTQNHERQNYLYVHDLAQSKTTPIGPELFSVSDNFVISSNGTCVTFVAENTARLGSLYWRSVYEPTHRIIASGSNFVFSVPDFARLSMTPDGSRTAFAGLPIGRFPLASFRQIYYWDSTNGMALPASLAPDGTTPAGNHCQSPVLSPDGNKILFSSIATNLVAQNTMGQWSVFLRDLTRNTTRLVISPLAATDVQPREPHNASLLGSDTRVLFNSADRELAEGDDNQTTDLFLINLGPSNPAFRLTITTHPQEKSIIIHVTDGPAGIAIPSLQFKEKLDDPAWINSPQLPDPSNDGIRFTLPLGTEGTRYFRLKFAN